MTIFVGSLTNSSPVCGAVTLQLFVGGFAAVTTVGETEATVGAAKGRTNTIIPLFAFGKRRAAETTVGETEGRTNTLPSCLSLVVSSCDGRFCRTVERNELG